MKYAIVDSGLNHIYINKQVIGGVSFYINCNKIIKIENEFEDNNGHGSMVFRIINERADPEDEFYIVKVLGEDNKGNSETLYEALKWLLHIDIKYIVICIATENLQIAYKYQKVIDQLSEQGKIIFSSWINNPESIYSYPAMLDSVISVGRGKLNTLEWECDFNRNVQCVIDIDPAFVCVQNKGFQLFGGNSQATADFAAIASKRIGDVKDIKEFTKKILKHNVKKKKLINGCNKTVNDCMLKLFLKYGGDVSTDTPFWRAFPSVNELSVFLEAVCDKYKIDRRRIVFRRSMFSNLLIFSESMEQIKCNMRKEIIEKKWVEHF